MKFLISVMLGAGALCVPVLAQVQAKQIAEVFLTLESNSAPGAAVLVIHHGQVMFRRGYGVADLRTKRKIDQRTNFRLASVTKQFTATAIMLLVHDGKLRYDEHLTDIFPEFPAYGRAITIRNLLNHTSGLPDYEDILTAQYPNTADTMIPQIHDAGVLKLLEQQSAGKFPAGTKWEYSNSGYAVLAMIVEKTSGQPFAQFLRQRIFAPLGMTRTIAYEKGTNEVFDRAYGYARVNSLWQKHDQSSTSAVLGDGGIYSSLADLEKWDRALKMHTLLSESEMQPALTPVLLDRPDGMPAQYGFGWFLNPYRGHRRMWHTGETVGFRTAIERFPEDQLSIIILCNRDDLNPEAMAAKVADLSLEKKN